MRPYAPLHWPRVTLKSQTEVTQILKYIAKELTQSMLLLNINSMERNAPLFHCVTLKYQGQGQHDVSEHRQTSGVTKRSQGYPDTRGCPS